MDMKRSIKILSTTLALALLVVCACTPEEVPSDPERDVTAAQDKDNYTVKGTVACDGTPLPGVLVSDGRNVAVTDLNGHYWLKSSSADDIVFVSIPSGYEVPVADNSWEPGFWYALDQEKLAAGGVQTFDFTLTKVNNDDFRLMVMTDVHIRGRHESIGTQLIDSVIFINSVRPATKTWREADRSLPTYGIVLGDMIQDAYIKKHNTGLPEYKALLRGWGYPLFHIPGNHEFATADGHGASASDPENRASREYYRRHLGPTYYSFNLGKVHFVMLDGTRLTGNKTSEYSCEVSPRQLRWLRQDLIKAFSKNRQDRPEKLVVCCHQPFFLYKTKNSISGCITNRNAVLEIIADAMIKEVVVLSGHIHFSDIVNDVAANSVKVNQYTHSALCGPFWIQNYNWDDSPNGWTEYRFSGTTFSRKQYGYEPEYDKPVIVYKEDIGDVDGKDSLIVNIPAYEKGWSVKVQKNLGTATTLSPVSIKAPRYTEFYNKNINAYNGSHAITPRANVCHFFLYEILDKNAEYTLQVTSPDGNVYTDKVSY